MMPDLPKERLSFNEQPFTYTDIDEFGPTVKCETTIIRKTRSNQATHKRYEALFTCLTTIAAHLKLASDLSTDIFILALGRFIIHRGKPKEIHSNNGINFSSVDRELRKTLHDLNQ